MKKILVIGHSDIRNTYGASTSIRTHLNLMGDTNLGFYHICQKSIVRGYRKESEPFIRFKFKEMWVPFDQDIIKDKNQGFLANLIGVWVPNLMYSLTRYKIKNEVENYRPEVIHLNSIVLIRLANFLWRPWSKIIIHVREIISSDKKDLFLKYIDIIDLFICIDASVRDSLIRSFPSIESSKVIVIKNPFLIGFNQDEHLRKLFAGDGIKFAVVGGIYPAKGVEFICRYFLDCQNMNIKLYIVGKINRLAKKIKNKYKSQKIIWLDEVDEFSARGGFMNIDILARGESEFCTGRSTYEALESGCYVIQPGTIKDLERDPELSVYSNQINFYEPRSGVSFVQAISDTLDRLKFSPKRLEVKHTSLNKYKNQIMCVYQSLI
ncbi:glycosyltransferase [beta proteobacterium MWH-UniP1]